MREGSWRAVVATVACAALLGWALFADALPGADAVSTVGIATAVALLVLALLVGVPVLERYGAVAAVALVALTGWAALSIAWSIAPDRSWEAVNVLLASLAFGALGAVLAGAAAGGAARLVAAVVTGVLALAIGWALLGVAVPALFTEGDRIARLREPIGHAPALALLAGALLPLAGRMLGGDRATRVAGGLLAYAAVVTLMMTQSRAGLVAAVVVVVVWAVVASQPLAKLARLVPAVVPALLVAAFAYTQSPLVDDGSLRADRVDAGVWFAVAAALGAVVAVAGVLRLSAERVALERPRLARRVAAVAAIALVAGGAVALAVGDSPFSAGECANDPSRLLGACANNRLDWWEEAWEVYRAHPALGAGALTFEVARTQVRESAVPVAEPHSVPLQVLADLGLVGLALGVVAAGAIALGLRAAVGRLDGGERQAAAALVALPLAFAVHGLLDYDADFLAVTAPTLFAVGGVLAAGRRVARVPVALAPVALVGVAIVSASLLLPLLSSRAVDDAYEAVAEGNADEARRLADRAVALNPLSIDARLARADAADDDAAAERAYRRITEMQPENADGWYRLGLYYYEFAAKRDACGAYSALNQSYTLDPRSDRWASGGVLDRARDDVNLRRACG